MNRIYLDNASTTKLAPEVVTAMEPYLQQTYGNASALHHFGKEAKLALEKSRGALATAIRAEPHEIIFTSGGTESDNLAIQGIMLAYRLRGNHLIISGIEHPAIFNTAAYLEKQGFKVTRLPVDECGRVSPSAVRAAITSRTILVSVMHANNEVGTLQDIVAIAKLCREHEVLFHTDAIQSFTKIPLDVKTMPVDAASLSAHKIHGPKGIGALYVRTGVRMQQLLYGGPHEFGKRSGTENIPGAVGFAAAVHLAKPSQIARMAGLRDWFSQQLHSAFPSAVLHGHPVQRLCSIINCSFPGHEADALLHRLDEHGIAVSTGSACSSAKDSHVLRAMGVPLPLRKSSLRFSISRYTTKKELSIAIDALGQEVKR